MLNRPGFVGDFILWKPHGKQIAVIPFMSGRYQENFDDLSAVERHTRFGQHDHVRRIGKEDLEMTLGKL